MEDTPTPPQSPAPSPSGTKSAIASQIVVTILGNHSINQDNASMSISDEGVEVHVQGKKHNELVKAGKELQDALYQQGTPLPITIFESASAHAAKIYLPAKTSDDSPGAQTEIRL